MLGYRFFEELKNKNRKAETSQGTVVALLLERSGRGWRELYTGSCHSYDGSPIMECVSGVFDEPNSPVCSSGVSRSYLDQNCRRISEEKAREIHPKIFHYLDQSV